MERILKLEENLKQLSQDLSDKARSAVIFLPLADIESDEEAAVEPRAPPVKQQCIFAPAVALVLPLKKSPAVSVRMINFIIIACINILLAHRNRSLLVTMNPKPICYDAIPQKNVQIDCQGESCSICSGGVWKCRH